MPGLAMWASPSPNAGASTILNATSQLKTPALAQTLERARGSGGETSPVLVGAVAARAGPLILLAAVVGGAGAAALEVARPPTGPNRDLGGRSRSALLRSPAADAEITLAVLHATHATWHKVPTLGAHITAGSTVLMFVRAAVTAVTGCHWRHPRWEQRAMRRSRGVLALAGLVTVGALGALGACGSATVLPSTAAVAPAPAGQYVALGDSYVAGPGIPALSGVPLGCARSSNDYPALVAATAHFAFVRDVSCSGATTADMTHPQSTPTGPNPPQLGALGEQTTLVTLTIGANDIGFADIVAACLSRSTDPTAGAPCRAHYSVAGGDVLAERIAASAAKVAATVEQIKARAPAAVVLIVGYPTVLGAAGGCPEAPLSAGDTTYLSHTLDALNSMLHAEADRSGAQFVDTATSSAGHSTCTPPGTRWGAGQHPTAPAAPFHPNALSMHNSATQILHALHLIP